MVLKLTNSGKKGAFRTVNEKFTTGQQNITNSKLGEPARDNYIAKFFILPNATARKLK